MKVYLIRIWDILVPNWLLFYGPESRFRILQFLGYASIPIEKSGHFVLSRLVKIDRVSAVAIFYKTSYDKKSSYSKQNAFFYAIWWALFLCPLQLRGENFAQWDFLFCLVCTECNYPTWKDIWTKTVGGPYNLLWAAALQNFHSLQKRKPFKKVNCFLIPSKFALEKPILGTQKQMTMHKWTTYL